MKDVLWVTPIPPDRQGGGGHVRQAYLLLALAQHARVHLICSQPVHDPLIREAAASVTDLDLPEPGSQGRSIWVRRIRDLWFATLGREPREVAEARAIRRRLAAVMAGGPTTDLAVVEYAGLADLGGQLPVTTRRLLTLHNVGSVMAAQQAAVEPGRRQRWLYQRDEAKWRRWERKVADPYKRVITVSTEDADSLGITESRRAVVPNGVDTERYAATPLPRGPALVFTGALYTWPNRDGLTWFCSEVLPLVRQHIPETTMTIVGMRPGPDIVALGELPGVRICPDVPDMAPYLLAARVAVVPLRIGSGSRLKALEAMASGRPVVGTTIGLEGLGVRPGCHAAVADDPDSFAAAILRAIQDEGWATALAGEARRFVEDRYSWRRISDQFVDAVLGEAQTAEQEG